MTEVLVIFIVYVVGALLSTVVAYAFFGNDPETTSVLVVAWPFAVIIAVICGVVWVLFKGPKALGLAIHSWVEEAKINDALAEEKKEVP